MKIEPNYVNAHTNLGNLFLQKGRLTEAIAEYAKSLELAPQDNPAEINLAWVLATCSDPSLRDGKRAVALAQRANELSGGKNPLALRSLAAAYAEIGEFSKASEAARKAWQFASESNNEVLMKALSKEMEFYSAKLPYRR